MTVASSPGMPATTMSPLSAVGLGPHDDEVAVEDAGVDHRLAPDPQHEQLAVAGEIGRERDDLLDVLLREHAGAGRDVADERDVADRATVGGGAAVGVVADLDGTAAWSGPSAGSRGAGGSRGACAPWTVRSARRRRRSRAPTAG